MKASKKILLTFINFIIHKSFKRNILWDFVFYILKYRFQKNKIFITSSRFISGRYRHYSFYPRNIYVAYTKYIHIYILRKNLQDSSYYHFLSIFFHIKIYLKSIINFCFLPFAKHLIFDHCAKQTAKELKTNTIKLENKN